MNFKDSPGDSGASAGFMASDEKMSKLFNAEPPYMKAADRRTEVDRPQNESRRTACDDYRLRRYAARPARPRPRIVSDTGSGTGAIVMSLKPENDWVRSFSTIGWDVKMRS